MKLNSFKYSVLLSFFVVPIAIGNCGGSGCNGDGGCFDNEDCEDAYSCLGADPGARPPETGSCVPNCSSWSGQPGYCVFDSDCDPGTQCDNGTLLASCTCVSGGTGGNGGGGGTGGGSGGTALSCATACGELECVEFSDDAFVDADWEDTQVYATDNDYLAEQRNDDGKDAPYRFTRHTLGMNSSIWVAHTKTGADYNPSMQGAIESIHCAFDGRALEGSRQASVRALLQQGGRWFWTPFDDGYGLIDENGWAYREWSPASWEPAGHSVDLDLGAPMTFGFATGASHTTGLEEVIRDTGVDNWHVVICTEP